MWHLIAQLLEENFTFYALAFQEAVNTAWLHIPWVGAVSLTERITQPAASVSHTNLEIILPLQIFTYFSTSVVNTFYKLRLYG